MHSARKSWFDLRQLSALCAVNVSFLQFCQCPICILDEILLLRFYQRKRKVRFRNIPILKGGELFCFCKSILMRLYGQEAAKAN
ncbi:MAG: hypothetical protein A2Y81_08645 [Nitrospirae bacterium RBG_13_43_8]|nr:MAG: hypothetical protein A2Y81_08645 [Nitrospirae bacterium RBG_13_43_8]